MATVDDFINKMKTQLGKPYVWGGESPNVGFDCSGLIYWALKSLGITGWTHQSEALINQAKPISVAQGKTTKGALLYYPGHIVVSLGNGQIIEAPQPGTPVRITGDYGGWTRAGTIPQLTNTPTTPNTTKKRRKNMFMLALRNGRGDGQTIFAITGAGYWNEFTGQSAADNLNKQICGYPALILEGKAGVEFWNQCQREAKRTWK